MQNQTFTIIYKNDEILVDPYQLCNASKRFKELYQPFIESQRTGEVHLEILYDGFTERNIENFLKLCQNLPTDVQDSEMKEICEIARMFGADQIYQTGLEFITKNIDPNFSVPENKYENNEEHTYLFMETEGTTIHHIDDQEELEFASSDEDTSSNQMGKPEFIPMANEQQNNQSVPASTTQSVQQISTQQNPMPVQNANSPQTPQMQGSTSIAAQYNPRGFNQATNQSTTQSTQSFDNQNHPETNQNDAESNDTANKYSILDGDNKPQEFGASDDENQKAGILDDKQTQQTAMKILNNPEPKGSSVIYQLQIEYPFAKCTRYVCSKGGIIIMAAKQRFDEVVIGEGSEVHINKTKSNHIGRIVMEPDGIDIIHLKDQTFKIRFITSEKPYYTSMEVCFIYKGTKLTWRPRAPYYNPKNNKYYISLHGEYHHYAIKSRRNTVLQNHAGHTTFIVRKMQKNLYEIECHQSIDPVIAFALGICQVVGPYEDPLDFFD